MSSGQQPELLIECHQLYLAFVETRSMIFRRLFTECACKCGIDESNIQILCGWDDTFSAEYQPKIATSHTSFVQEETVSDNTSFTSSGFSVDIFVGSHIIGL